MTNTVYLIDDEPELVELLSDVVELAGLKAQGYTQASQFFEQVEVFSPNSILVLDLNMPGMDGIEVMRQLARTENPPVLILISGTDIGLLKAAEKLGQAHQLQIIATLSKPVNIDALLNQLRHHTSISKQYQSTPVATSEILTAEELKFAISKDQLTLHYQPQLDMKTGKLTGVESLVRWNHPTLGMIYPDRFIPLAEESGLIGELTHWVIDHSVRQNQLWLQQDILITLSINISANDITSLSLPEQMTKLLAENQVDPTFLTMEVTESALMGELITSLDILTRLRLKGINLSIDDFGTGYSSLSQLHKIPFTELKIDRSFVDSINEDPEAKAIVKTCIILAHELNMKAVAEGIENQQTWDILVELGCDIAQGYFISRPMPGNELAGWVKNRL